MSLNGRKATTVVVPEHHTTQVYSDHESWALHTGWGGLSLWPFYPQKDNPKDKFWQEMVS
jgi:hypothetical protein